MPINLSQMSEFVFNKTASMPVANERLLPHGMIYAYSESYIDPEASSAAMSRSERSFTIPIRRQRPQRAPSIRRKMHLN
jgi:hypothetical protein